MKKSLTVFTLLAGAVGIYAQGSIHFDDYVNNPGDVYTISIWSPQVATPTVQLSGDGPSDFPAGTQTGYTGTLLGGSGTGAVSPSDYANGNLWSIALYAAPGASQPLSALTAVPGAQATLSTAGYAGQWDTSGGVVVAVPGVAFGGTGTFALAAWYNGGGTLTYAEAVAAADPAAFSPLETITLAPATSAPGSLNPIPSFSLVVTPEPSTIALGVIGASAFLLRLRRK
jgi:hypothetical protein